MLQDRNEAGIGHAEQALALAEQLGLERPALALGYRGLARTELGDRRGLDDLREAITLATQAGPGQEVALLHNNLAYALTPIEGPAATLEGLRAGVAFAQARGLTEMADLLTATTVEALADTDEHEQALALAGDLAARYEVSGNTLDLTAVVSAQARILTLRGQAVQVKGTLDWLETTTREAGGLEYIVTNLTNAAFARAALGERDQAAALLAEVDARPAVRQAVYYVVSLPTMVRTALAIGDGELAERLAAGVEPRTPYAEHALVTVSAALAEARGDLKAAVEGYADAADRWQSFSVVPEQAFALLGQGRTLTAQGRTTEAEPVLHRPAGSSRPSRPPPRSSKPTCSSNKQPRSARRPRRLVARLLGVEPSTHLSKPEGIEGEPTRAAMPSPAPAEQAGEIQLF